MTRRERSRLWWDRICYVCGKQVPDGDGVGFVHLNIMTHKGPCTGAVDYAQRDFTHSAKGRRRHRASWLRHILRVRT